jgi:hypothetical protein
MFLKTKARNGGLAGKGICKVMKTKGWGKWMVGKWVVGSRRGENAPTGHPGATALTGLVRKLLIPKERFPGVPPPRVFCKKSLEVVENKGRKREKEGKEAATI